MGISNSFEAWYCLPGIRWETIYNRSTCASAGLSSFASRCPWRHVGSGNSQVRKGEHGSLVVYANRITKTETNEQGEDTEREIPYMKGYTVFNVEQVEGPARALLRAAGEPLAALRAH